MGLFLAWMLSNVFISSRARGYMNQPMAPFELVCQLPVISSYWILWPCSDFPHPRLSAVDFVALSQTEGDTLQALLEESVGIVDVGWDLWRADVAVGDLIRYLHSSDLNSKVLLIDSLQELQRQIQSSMDGLRSLRTSIIRSVQR